MIALEQGAIQRDRWGRPLLDGKPYTRVSTLAKTLDDTSALLRWRSRMTAIGLARSEDLVGLLAVTDAGDRDAVDRIVEQALERAQTSAAASTGTTIHAATELLDRGDPIDGLPVRIREDARAYRRAIDGARLEPLAAEVFCVNEGLGAAGSFDRVVQGPTRAMILDLKTSANPDTARWAALAWAVQLATYARSLPWLPGRGPVPWSEVGLPEPDPDLGVVAHVVQGSGEARLYRVDLAEGWRAARLAADVRGLRGRRDIVTPA